MAEQSAIEWTDATFNPWIGCTRIGPGCDHCYAEDLMARRYGRVEWGAGKARSRTSPANWRKPVAWNAKAAAFVAEHGRRRRVFCASLADVFDNDAPAEWRADLFDLIRNTPDLDWLLLTKRIGNAPRFLPADWGDGYGNVWLGSTVVNQAEADRDLEKLRAVPAAIRFLSIEPLLGPIDRLDLAGVDWVITGGESGPRARSMRVEWIRSIRDQCQADGVAFFHKQYGVARNNPLYHHALAEVSPTAWLKRRDPNGKGGALVDGKLWREFPLR
jgi:protein gp37